MFRSIWVRIIVGWVIAGFLLFIPYAWLVGGVHNTILSIIIRLVAPAVILVFAFLIDTARSPSVIRKEKENLLLRSGYY